MNLREAEFYRLAGVKRIKERRSMVSKMIPGFNGLAVPVRPTCRS